MRLLRQSVFITVLILFNITLLLAQKSTARFLFWPLSAKYTALGGTGVSYCNDSFAGYYNPAGFAFSKFSASGAVVGPYHAYLNTRTIQYSSSIYTSIGAIGFTLTEFWKERQMIMDESGTELGLDGDDFDLFNPTHWEAKLSCAAKINKNIAFGTNISLLHVKLTEAPLGAEKGKADTYTVLFGAGVMFRNLFKHWTYRPGWKHQSAFLNNLTDEPISSGLNIGISFKNLGPNIIYIDEAQSDPPPSLLTAGFSYWPIASEFFSFMMACDFESYIYDSSTLNYIHMGGELLFGQEIALRTGYYLDTEEPKTSFVSYGFGLRFLDMWLNFAWYKKDIMYGIHIDAIYKMEF